MRKLLMSLLSVGLLVIITACGFGGDENSDNNTSDDDSGDNNSSDNKVIELFESSEMPSMDSSHAHDGPSFTTLNNVNEGLYRADDKNNPQLAVAESVEVNDDETVLTFTLRDANWSNGEPVTAHDFEYAWKRTFEVVGHYSDMFVTANLENAQAILDEEMEPDELGVEATDDKTLVVTLESPSPLFTQLLTFPTFFPLNEDFVEEAGDQYGTEADKVLFNGAFVLDSWAHDQGWVMKKNTEYWDADEVQIDQVNVNVVKETSTLVNLWETDELDRIELSASYVDEYTDDENFFVEEMPSIIFMRMNHNIDAFLNEDIRKAIDMVIDKESMTDVILNDGSKPLNSLIPANFSFSSDEEDFREINGLYNEGTQEEAKELWEKGLSDLGEDNLEFKLTVSDDEAHQKIAEYVKDQMESNFDGISLEIKKVPFEARLEQEKAVDYDMVISTWGPDYNDPLTFLEMWITDGSANRMDYSNKDYDELIGKIRTETDVDKRFDYMLEAENIFLDEMEIIPLVQDADSVLMRQNIKGMVRHPVAPQMDYKAVRIE